MYISNVSGTADKVTDSQNKVAKLRENILAIS